MNWLDVVLALILVASVVTSFRKGLSREVIGLVAVCLALVLGIWLYGLAGSYLIPYLSSRAMANFAGFAIVFCGVMLAGGLVSLFVGRFLKITGLSFFDHILGAGFGILRGMLIAVALVTGIMAFSTSDRPPASVVNSHLAPYVVGAARMVAAIAPYEVKEGFRKTYARVKSAWKDGGKGILPAGEKVKNEREI
ncbi:MAG TPA: CvpA family protein [Bryobacteraceae bacterium]|jgi:membrane protein required for colicin V production|nr:CvpA family protein [Bryobacteraceae bacterium]